MTLRSPILTRSRDPQPPSQENPNQQALLGVQKNPVASNSNPPQSSSPPPTGHEQEENLFFDAQSHPSTSNNQLTSAPTSSSQDLNESQALAVIAGAQAVDNALEQVVVKIEGQALAAIAGAQVVDNSLEQPVPNGAMNDDNANANPVADNLANLAQLLLTLRPPLPEYHGLDHENPENYLAECEQYLTELNVPEGRRVKIIEKGLKDEAEKWWQCYRSMGVNWARFQNLVRGRFDNQAIKNSLVARLYGARQGEKDSVGAFLQHKYMLYQRLRPNEPEDAKITALVGLLRPCLRKALRAQNPADFSDLLSKAIEAEKDDEDEQKALGKNKQKTEGAEAKPKAEKVQGSPPQCWHCPEYHFHRDCPVLKNKQNDNHLQSAASTLATQLGSLICPSKIATRKLCVPPTYRNQGPAWSATASITTKLEAEG